MTVETDNWPTDVKECYRVQKVLGQGGFAKVMLAVHVEQQDTDNNSSSNKTVAMKQVQADGYAYREIDILKELGHRNIVGLHQHWHLPDQESPTILMALEYVPGRTLLSLLEEGGALSLTLSRVIGSQIVAGLAYLHSRAVVHRDIKPDNIIVQGELVGTEAWEDKAAPDEEEEVVNFAHLVEKHRVVLIDFGFARALSPSDMHKPMPRPDNVNASHHSQVSLTNSGADSSTGSMRRSRRLYRSMSAVGNRVYAAPEVQNDLRVVREKQGAVLADTVSVYGLMADAFSLGNTLKFMLTGVPPNENVNDVIAFERSPVALLLGLCCKSKISEHGVQEIRHRPTSKIPKEVIRLIRGLTQPDPSKRTPLRVARQYPWVDYVLPDEPDLTPSKISYLSFVETQESAPVNTLSSQQTTS